MENDSFDFFIGFNVQLVIKLFTTCLTDMALLINEFDETRRNTYIFHKESVPIDFIDSLGSTHLLLFLHLNLIIRLLSLQTNHCNDELLSYRSIYDCQAMRQSAIIKCVTP